jgi:hypothetical protein
MGFAQSLVTLRETLTHDFAKVAGWGRSIDSRLQAAGVSKFRRNFYYAAASTLAVAGAAYSPVQALGVASLAFLQMAPFMLDNRHKRGNAVLGCSLLAPQMVLLGAPVAALQVAIAGTRAQIMNSISDDSYVTRVSISAGFWASAIGIAHYAGFINSPVDILPLAAMTCGTIADACPDKASHVARVMRIGGASFLMPYHALVSGSLAGFTNESIGATNLARTAVQNDVPTKRADGTSLSLKQQWQGWWSSIRSGQRIDPSLAGRPDPLAQAAHAVASIFKPKGPA